MLGLKKVDVYLVKSVISPFLLLLLIICFAQVLYRTINLLEVITTLGSDARFLPALVWQVIPNYLDVSIPIAFSVAMIVVVVRFDNSQEIIAWAGARYSPARLVRPFVLIGLVLAGSSLYLRGWIEPVARHNFRSLQIQAINSGKLGMLEPSSVYQPTENFTFTYDQKFRNGKMKNPFLWLKDEDGREHIYTGHFGQVYHSSSQPHPIISLADGTMITRKNDENRQVRQAEFKRMRMSSENIYEADQWRRGRDHKELMLNEIVTAYENHNPRYDRSAVQAELWSRIARAAIIPLLPLLVFPLAVATRNGRRGAGLFLTCLILALAHHGLNIAKNIGALGAVSPGLSIGSVTAVFTIVCLLIFSLSFGLPGPSKLTNALNAITPRLQSDTFQKMPNLLGRKRKLEHYFLRQNLSWVLISLIVTVIYLFTVQMFESGDEFVARGLGLIDAGRFFLFGLPTWIFQAIPLALLAGGLVAFTGLYRNSELIAMQSSGFSIMTYIRALMPMLLVGALIMPILAAWIIPKSNISYTQWWNSTQVSTEPSNGAKRWFRIDNDIISARSPSIDGDRLRDLSIFTRSRDGRISKIKYAQEANYRDANWTMNGVTIHKFGSVKITTKQFRKQQWKTTLRPKQMAGIFAGTSNLSWQNIVNQRRGLAPTHRSQAYYNAHLFRIFVLAFVPLTIFLFVMPIASAGPQSSLWPYYCYASLMSLCYLLIDGYFYALAQTGQINVIIGTIFVTIISMMAATTILLYQEVDPLHRLLRP